MSLCFWHYLQFPGYKGACSSTYRFLACTVLADLLASQTRACGARRQARGHRCGGMHTPRTSAATAIAIAPPSSRFGLRHRDRHRTHRRRRRPPPPPPRRRRRAAAAALRLPRSWCPRRSSIQAWDPCWLSRSHRSRAPRRAVTRRGLGSGRPTPAERRDRARTCVNF